MRVLLFAPLPFLVLTGCTASLGRSPCASEYLPTDFKPFTLADKTYLDTQRSMLAPKGVLTSAGVLKGHWLARDWESELFVEPHPEDAPSDDFPEDHFQVRIRDGDQWTFYQYLEAAYGAFTIFGVDLDGDGIDEVVVEYGWGRGTSAYIRKLAIGKAGAKHLNLIFETALSGYLPGTSVSPDLW
jgi:hypothetical protein